MRFGFGAVAILLFVCLSRADAQDALPSQKEFQAPGGKGRVVVVVSGQSGPANYAHYAKDVAEQGFYAVLVDGNDFWLKGGGGEALLKGVITRAQESPNALPGKAAVIGFSLGGASTLAYATRMPELVSAVVVNYPGTFFITDPGAFVAKIKVPTLMLAGVRDTYKNCCLIETARKLADAAKANQVGAMFEVVEYPEAAHGWNIKASKEWREGDSADGLRRALKHLRDHAAE